MFPDSGDVCVCVCVFRFRIFCQSVIATQMFNYTVLLFILLNCVTIALERPGIHPGSVVRHLQTHTNTHTHTHNLIQYIHK